MLHIMGPHVECVGRRDVQRQMKLSVTIVSIPFHFRVCHCVFCIHSAEIDQKLQEIMKQTGYLKIDGQVRCAHRDILSFCCVENRFLSILLTNTIMY